MTRRTPRPTTRRSGLRFRTRVHVAPGVWANGSRRGLSWTLRMGPWSWNSHRRAYRMDLPGPLWWQGRPGRSPVLIVVAGIVPVAAVVAALVWAVAR